MSFDLQVALGAPPDRGPGSERLALPAGPSSVVSGAVPAQVPAPLPALVPARLPGAMSGAPFGGLPPTPGGLRRNEDTRPHPALGGSPVTFVSVELWDALAALAISPDATGATVHALLRALAALATDAALAPGNEGAPLDDLYVCYPAHIGAQRREVWFQRDGAGGPITALLLPRA